MPRILFDIWNKGRFALDEGVSAYTACFARRSVDELAGRFAAKRP
jgi:hypothetical protein